ncbi:MAG: hypothetical protein AUJ49_10840 [Desulfovibrionaceae bacterium CG1_02_65_16]|nr:MAG: hypothetical protein AUJ49_10840 [Desulfovibrionaceae bacterium CG1_02_65_16]
MARQLAAKNYANIRIIKSSFIDIDNADGMSSAGRVYPEVIGSRLAQLGYEIVELKVRSNSIKISPQTGVMLLSFDKNELSKTYNASAALVGYYKHFPYDQQTMLYVRIINLEDNTIMASDDVGIKD